VTVGRFFLLLTLGVAVTGSGIAVAYAKYQSRTLFAQLQDLREERDSLNIEWGQLQLEQSTWATPGRVETMARKRLGMRIPVPRDVVVLVP